MIIEGAISVKAAIEGRNRRIEWIAIEEGKESNDIRYIERIAQRSRLKLKRVSAEELSTHTSGKTHGGLIASVSARRYQTLQELAQGDWVVLVEGVEDPFNLGQMIRTAYAAGASGILLNHRQLEHVEPVLLKSSAGAYDRCPIVLSETLSEDLKRMQAQGFKLVMGMRQDSSVDYRLFSYPDKLILAIGGEMRGLSRGVKDAADASVIISYPNQTKVALSAVSACAVLCFEVASQRTRKP